MSLEILLPLLGRWAGRATISSEGRDPIELWHTEQVQLRNNGTIMTIEGCSRPAGSDQSSEPVFTAFAVVSPSQDGLRWHAYSHGTSLDTELVVTRGHFSWNSPGQPPIRYTANFDENHWSESGLVAAADGTDHQMFLMDMTRA